MIGKILTVSGYTLLSRLTGFMRDIMLAAIIGAGPLADAFFVAFRLPNHFRAIFAEGAFNAAFIPAYARVRTQGGPQAASLFGDRIFTLLLASQVVLLALALIFTPQAIEVLAPGFSREPQQFALAVSLTRITFPYLLLITLVTLWSGILNALHRFASAAAAPILLNVTMMATLAVAFLFPSAGHAAAWGVLISGVLQAALVGGDTFYAGVMTSFRALRWDDDVRRFFKALLPATVGSAGTQLALFADTIIASFLSAGAISALYYADRIDQLPIGVIGIAIGTVLVPEMTHRLAAGDEAGARSAQNRAIEFALLLAVPCVVAFIVVPGPIMRGLFMRGAFNAADAHAAALTLMAYTIGLVPFVLIRSVVAPFLARGDTATPVKAALIGTAVNIVLKVALMFPLAQVGLALATSIGAWINFILVLIFAARANVLALDAALKSSLTKLTAAGAVMAVVLLIADPLVTGLSSSLPRFGNETNLILLAAIGGVVYGGLVAVMFGRRWLSLMRRTETAPVGPDETASIPAVESDRT
ncbi:MAG TPA: murein biosynthesis integral membrane protein MurJ [Xanthobacteraceae bacterium]|jgi:putative peptidoglycan lipid II flippase|nr:murein biosynthesis integral membrane protein MurJ [Xanthobacteraceae bacterium]